MSDGPYKTAFTRLRATQEKDVARLDDVGGRHWEYVGVKLVLFDVDMVVA